jgi:hypothetical protein
MIYRKNEQELKQLNEILPPGQTKDFIISDNNLYTLDLDSGLTLYQSLEHELKVTRMPLSEKYKWMQIDTSYFYFISQETGISVYSKSGLLPDELITNLKLDETDRTYFFKDYLLIANFEGLRMFRMEGKMLELKDHLKQLTQIHRIKSEDEDLIVLTGDGTVYKMAVSENSKLQTIAETIISPKPTNISYSKGKLYCAYVYRGRFLSFFDLNLQVNFTRLALWRAGWEIWKDHPLFGVGDIDLAKYYLKYKRPFDKEIHGHLHNNYFHFLATLGLFGFLALMYLFFKIFKKIARIYSSTKGKPFIASYSIGAIASVASILVSGLSEMNFWDQEIATLIYFTVGLNVALYIHYNKEKEVLNEKQ